MSRRALAALLGLCLGIGVGVGDAGAAPRRVALVPGQAAIGFRAYALGLWPTDGAFTRFVGTLTYDPAMPGPCAVDATVDVASLWMRDPALREDVLSPNLLDAARFASLAFRGVCRGDQLVGDLTLHGQTHPFVMAITRDRTSYLAEGRLDRAAWGITGRRLLAGPHIRIQVSTALPP